MQVGHLVSLYMGQGDGSYSLTSVRFVPRSTLGFKSILCGLFQRNSTKTVVNEDAELLSFIAVSSYCYPLKCILYNQDLPRVAQQCSSAQPIQSLPWMPAGVRKAMYSVTGKGGAHLGAGNCRHSFRTVSLQNTKTSFSLHVR